MTRLKWRKSPPPRPVSLLHHVEWQRPGAVQPVDYPVVLQLKKFRLTHCELFHIQMVKASGDGRHRRLDEVLHVQCMPWLW